jgi:hypothetical protein
VCDFRGPPQFVENLFTGKRESVPYRGVIHPDPDKRKLIPGIYYVACTGSYYTYYDGEDFWQDRNEWGGITELSIQYWPPYGVHPRYNRYRFIFPPNPPKVEGRLDLNSFSVIGQDIKYSASGWC